MTYTIWNREQYTELDQMVRQKNKTPDELAAKFKLEKKDLYYRMKLLEKRTNIQTWAVEELELLEKSKNIDAYVQGCLELYGKNHHDKNIYIAHWMNRERYLAAWFKEKDERKKAKAVELPKEITTPRKEDVKRDNLPDIGDQMATLIDRVNMNTAILKELLKVQTDTYTLFNSKFDQQERKIQELKTKTTEELTAPKSDVTS